MPFPVAFDSTFPGYPYVDATEYIDATQANAWVAAIQAIEATIGYGTAGTPASPLYSSVYATTYTTITARMAAIESNISGGIKINTASGNIQPVGVSNTAGSTGLAADAGHTHSGVTAGSLKQIGEVFMWPGAPSTFPSGCFQCNGQLISTSTYSTLFGIIGYTYGGTGGSFAVPNYNDKFPIGVNSTASSVGATGGSTTITTNNLPSHSHSASGSDSGHYHQISSPFGGGSGFQPLIGQQGFSGTWAAGGNGSQFGAGGLGINWDNILQTQNATANISVSVGNTGNGAAYNQPFIGTYFLIRAI